MHVSIMQASILRRSSRVHPRAHPIAPNLLTLAVLCALAPPLVSAQSVNATDAANLDAVTVTGIRGSLQSSLNLKRDSQGVMDGIIAEDIGKFPDTNLAESLQRISGVSIDRTASGEGSRVTVRGVGPDFNLVLLNGRQMPASNLGDNGTGISGSRAFDFVNLASEAVSELQVYKTTRADTPTGGIGATINIRTARALENPGLHANIGIKGVMDRSVDRLPRSYSGSSLTPEVSGIFSNTFADGRFGVAATASYQERDSGFSEAAVNAGWYTFKGLEGSADPDSRLPRPGDDEYDAYTIVNPPGMDVVYGRPQNFNLSVNGVRRQRRNAQLAVQFAPTETITATLDYTYAENKVQRQRNELSAWLNFTPGYSVWTDSDGPIAGPLEYTEYSPNGNFDLAMHGRKINTDSELKSLGFNVEWQVNEDFDLTLDYHDSRAVSRPDNPYGSSIELGAAAFVRGHTTIDFSRPFPIFTIALGPGVTEVHPSQAILTGSVFSTSYNRSNVEQFQASGTFRFAGYQALDFGLGQTEVYNRSASAAMNMNSWGGVGTPDDYDDSIWYADNMGKYFGRFSGHDDSKFSDRFLIFDFDRLHQRAIEVTGCAECYRAPDEFTTDIRTTETSRNAWLQWRNTFDGVVPISVTAGVRYEETKIVSPAQVPPPAGSVRWVADNTFNIELGDDPVFSNYRGKYDYWLPSLDVRADLNERMVLRSSYSHSIGRPGWREIQGGLSVQTGVRVQGGFGNLGNPGLLPLESKNFDLAFEWYYSEGSYAALGYFRKDIKNFISNTVFRDRPYPDVHTPVGGGYWNEAIAAGCAASDLPCIRGHIFLHHGDDPGVDYRGQSSSGRYEGTITGLPGDPVAEFEITTPANQRSDKLDGFELSVQHMFGSSGFGIFANYTKVDSGLRFDNYSLGEQYPMVGLSDSANLVLFYDKYDWQVRVAYNWRDDFLSGIGGAGPNPDYTESYGQLDMNVTWQMNQHLSVFVEGINLTDETRRVHTRHRNMLRFASQTGPRYMFGLRYKF